ncbi:MAG: hypothetical protein N4A33_00330 [Bacteriovoracaceae bacterium]|jgi:hypothetical protein|nr:hypothetical protein [Bacteriovoracaceae bacterium]
MKIVLLYCLINLGVFANSSFSDSFIITIKEGKTVVVAQEKKNKFASVIIKNDTFEKMICVLSNESEKMLESFSLKPGHSSSFQISYKSFKKLFFYTLSPPSQKLPLKVGKKSYEIP